MFLLLTLLQKQQLSVNESFNILLGKLKRFKTKFYLNKLLRGLILSATILLVAFLVVDVFEYYSWSDPFTRTILFYLFVALMVIVLSFQVFVPMVQLFKMGKQLSHKDAAIIIGDHFPEISDKLLNTLQLHSTIDTKNSDQIDLLLAGIEQRTNNLQPIPFRKAVSYKSNYKYLKWMAAPLAILMLALIISPAFVLDPANRIVNHKNNFEKPLPYSFKIINDSLVGIQGEDFTVKLRVEGEEYPESVYFNDGKYDFRITESNNGVLEYTLTKLKNDVYFSIATDEVVSEQFQLKVLPKPSISSFSISLDFPNYLKKKDELVESTGDIVVPEGTKLNWRFYANNSEELVFINETANNIKSVNSENLFEYRITAKSDFNYSVYSISKHKLSSDTLNYSVNVVNDEKPSIVINNLQQDYLLGYLMASGTISDDYGFSSLRFYYKNSDAKEWTRNNLNFDKNIEKQNFNHSFNTMDIGLKPGDNLDFYYEVWDNDRVNGFKRSKTNTLVFEVPDKEEIIQKSDSTSDLMKSKYESSIKDLDELSKELDELKKAMFEKKDIDWSDKKKIKDLINSEKDLRESLQEMQELNSKREELKKFLKDNPNQSIQEKLDKLTEQLEKLKQNELLEKLEELSKDIDELSKDELDDLLDELKENQEDFKESLEQQLEFFKQLEIEQKLNEATKDLKELAEKQKKLADETKEKENKLKDALDEQNELNKEFKKIEEKIEEIDSLNSELEKPLDLDGKQDQQEDIEQEMDQASENLSSGKRKKSGESQTSAAQKLEELANQLDMMMQEAMESRMGEDIEQTKKLLDNLMDISFNVEELMQEISMTSENDPKFLENTKNLKIIKDDYAILHDSLMELSKRQVMIQNYVVKESDKVEMYFERSLASIQERRIGQTSNSLQYAMTSANNLALMLDESLNQMKQSMNMPGSKSGKGKCKNPGSGKKPGEGMSEMMKMQKKLGDGMKKMGKKNGAGKKSGKGKSGESKELARMAAQQSELRKQIQELMDQLEGEGGNGSALQKIIDKMEEQENDIVNKQISSETIERQKEIETRLLQAEKAMLEREKEERREASEGKSKKRGNYNNEIQYKNTSIDNSNNVINKKPLKLNTPYKKLLKKYLYEIESQDTDVKK